MLEKLNRIIILETNKQIYLLWLKWKRIGFEKAGITKRNCGKEKLSRKRHFNTDITRLNEWLYNMSHICYALKNKTYYDKS